LEFGALSLLPPFLAIAIALVSRHVFAALTGGIVVGEIIAAHFDLTAALLSLFERLLRLLGEAWILKTLAFALLVGSVMALLRASGGISALVHALSEKRSLIHSGRGALLLTYMVGVVIFIESSITSLIAGAVGRPLCDRYGVSRAKLAFVCDSTSAPICSLIVLNGWGALILGLIVSQMGSASSVTTLLHAVMYNFYAMAALLVTLAVILFDLNTPAMRRATVMHEVQENSAEGRLFDLLLPIGVMMATVFATLWITGDGDLMQGSGSSAIFYAMVVTLLEMAWQYRLRISRSVWIREAFDGARSMGGITLILLLAFLIGDVTKSLQTGLYLASFASEMMHPALLAGTLFVLSAIMAFATGTSWGTFSIMIPIAIPMGVSMGSDVALLIGAVISGGVFGDHCSPISDTTIISSMAAGCDHIEHVKTQLPYALISALIALGAFLIFGVLEG